MIEMLTDLVGTWTLASASMVDEATGEISVPWRQRPNGCLVLTDKRWLVIQTAESREQPRDDQDRAAAFRSMLAYSGTYRVDANVITIAVDVACDESWVGSDQTRLCRIADGRLHIEAPPQRYNLGGRVLRGLLVWERRAELDAPHTP